MLLQINLVNFIDAWNEKFWTCKPSSIFLFLYKEMNFTADVSLSLCFSLRLYMIPTFRHRVILSRWPLLGCFLFFSIQFSLLIKKEKMTCRWNTTRWKSQWRGFCWYWWSSISPETNPGKYCFFLLKCHTSSSN